MCQKREENTSKTKSNNHKQYSNVVKPKDHKMKRNLVKK